MEQHKISGRQLSQTKLNRRKSNAPRLSKTIEQNELFSEEMSGEVICNFGSQVDVEGHEDAFEDKVYRCNKRANLEPLVAGDKVIWKHSAPYGIVIARKSRSSEILRPDNKGKIRSMAANIDSIAIVFACVPKPQCNLIDRYLVAAEAQNVSPILILNKIDLIKDHSASEIQLLVKKYRRIGYPIIMVSSKTGEGMSILEDYLRNRIVIFSGQSGVGKTSLLNYLLPSANSPVRELSSKTDQGAHTTVASRLYRLKSGGKIIDSPGIREFSLNHLDRKYIIETFIDFRPFLGLCKFRDCTHTSEASCALLKAVREKLILDERLESYHKIMESF
jgi:ribosome biogenesis GTPase